MSLLYAHIYACVIFFTFYIADEATQFYADIQGHPQDENEQLALEELAYFTSELKILGAYPADTAR